MKKPMLKLSFGLSLVLLAAASSPIALAGEADGSPVWVNGATSTYGASASGAIEAARYSSDGVQNISCTVDVWTTTGASASCFAEDAKGTEGSCVSTDPDIIASARMINATSYIQFISDTRGTCTYLLVQNSSSYIH